MVQKGKVGRNKDSSLFFNMPTLDEAIGELENIWKKFLPQQLSLNTETRGIQRAVWVCDGTAAGRVGVKVMVLTSHLIYRFASDAKTTLGTLKNSSSKFKSDYKKSKNLTKREQTLFEKMANPTHDRLAGYNDQDEHIFTHFMLGAKKHLNTKKSIHEDDEKIIEDAKRIYDNIVFSGVTTARGVFTIIAREWLKDFDYITVQSTVEDKKTTAGSRPAFHKIPDNFKPYVLKDGVYSKNRNPQTIVSKAASIYERLKIYNCAEKLIVLHGNQNAGKSGVVVEILRSCHSEGNFDEFSMEINNKTTNEKIFLPVFMENVQNIDSKKFLFNVNEFLIGIDKGKLKPSNNRQNNHNYDSKEIEHIKNDIRTLHEKNPAFFILINWEDITWTSPRAQLRDQAKASIIKLLRDSNKNSRFLISTTKKPSELALSQIGISKSINLIDPPFEEIKRYFPKLTHPDVFRTELIEATDRLAGINFSGSFLILLATTLQICEGDPTWEKRAKQIIEELLPPCKESLLIASVVRLLFERLNELNLLRITLAIASSDDGLRLSSLIHLLKSWDKVADRDLKRKDYSIADGLNEMAEKAAGFFLRSRKISGFNPAQFSPGEEFGDEDSWEVHQTLRQIMLKYLQETNDDTDMDLYREFLREAMRRVSHLAFNRAQEWRSQTPMANLTPHFKDFLLDIQSYEALLASIDLKQLHDDAKSLNQIQATPLFYHALENIFGFGESHSAAVSLRFAAKILLGEYIDHNNKLSMCYDQDLVRARLYLLLFLPIGQKYFDLLDETQVRELPTTVPTWLRSVFRDEEILGFLEAIALSALHAQVQQLVSWAWLRTNEIVDAVSDNHVRRNLVAKSIRTFCSRMDMAIQMGCLEESDVTEDNDAVGHGATLSTLREFKDCKLSEAKKLISEKCDDKISKLRKASQPCLDEIKALLRLQAREAELLGLSGNLDEAVTMYNTIHQWEIALAAINCEGHAPILEGRPARVAIRLMMRKELSKPADLMEGASYNFDVKDRVIGMLKANSGRLVRFGGAEQVAVLIDKSRLAFFEENFIAAHRYAEEARRYCDDNRVSYGMQMQALVHNVGILIKSEQKTSEPALRPLMDVSRMLDAQRDMNIVTATAEALKLKPMQGVSLYLTAQLREIREKLHADKGLLENWLELAIKEIEKAISLMKECEDASFHSEMEELRDRLYGKRDKMTILN